MIGWSRERLEETGKERKMGMTRRRQKIMETKLIDEAKVNPGL